MKEKENYEATLNYIRELLTQSEIVNEDEKKYWSDLLEVMTQTQLLKLVNILVLDKKEEIQDFNKIMMLEYAKI
jgi:hypothetical protein